MRAVFPEKMWDIKANTGVYEVYHGSSAGRPWTEMAIFEYKLYDLCEQSLVYHLFNQKQNPKKQKII